MISDRYPRERRGVALAVNYAGGNLGTVGIQIAKNVIGATVIAAAGSDDRVHADLRIPLEKHEIIHTFSGCGQRKYAILLTRR